MTIGVTATMTARMIAATGTRTATSGVVDPGC